MLIKFAPFFVALCGILRSTDLYFRTPMVSSLAVLTLITWEHLINLAAVSPIILRNVRQYRQLSHKDLVLFCLIGCGASALGILCFTRAFLYMNPALAVLLQKLQPLITISLGALVLKESVSRKFLFWALIAILASYFVSFGLSSPFTGDWEKIATGAGFAVLAAFFWGSGTIWGKILLGKYDQMFVTANRFLFGAVFTLVLTFTLGNGLESEKILGQSLIYSIVYMAIISGFIATTFFYTGLKWVNATLVSILELFFPVSSVVIMWLSFNRPLSAVQIIAGLILFFAVFQVNRQRQD
ncbi:MAG: DMT family transporter [Candidatus Riflebacteria bacterium]